MLFVAPDFLGYMLAVGLCCMSLLITRSRDDLILAAVVSAGGNYVFIAGQLPVTAMTGFIGHLQLIIFLGILYVVAADELIDYHSEAIYIKQTFKSNMSTSKIKHLLIYIHGMCEHYDLNYNLVKSVISTESGWKYNAKSSAGAKGFNVGMLADTLGAPVDLVNFLVKSADTGLEALGVPKDFIQPSEAPMGGSESIKEGLVAGGMGYRDEQELPIDQRALARGCKRPSD